MADERAVAGLGIAQFGGLLGEHLSKAAEFVAQLRSVFLPVTAQRTPSRWQAAQSAPT